MSDEQDNVISLVTKPEEDKEDRPTAEDTFARASEAGLVDIAIVGFNKDGEGAYVTNIPNLADLIYMLEVAKADLLSK